MITTINNARKISIDLTENIGQLDDMTMDNAECDDIIIQDMSHLNTCDEPAYEYSTDFESIPDRVFR